MEFKVGSKRYVVSISYSKEGNLTYSHPFEGYHGNMKFLIDHDNTIIKELVVIKEQVSASAVDMGSIGGFGYVLTDQKTSDLYFHNFPRMTNIPGLITLAVGNNFTAPDFQGPIEYYDLETLLNELRDKISNFKVSVNNQEQRKQDNEELSHLVNTNTRFLSLLETNFPLTYIKKDIDQHSRVISFSNKKEKLFICERNPEHVEK